MTPEGILTYCRFLLHNDRSAMAKFWLPGKMTRSGRARMFDRRGPSGAIQEEKVIHDEPHILVHVPAQQVIKELKMRLEQDRRRGIPGRTARITQKILPAEEIVFNVG